MFIRSSHTIWVLVIIMCCGCTAPQVSKGPIHTHDMAVKIVEQSLTAHGGVTTLLDAGVTIELEGSFDLTTRLQGRNPDKAEPTPIQELMVLYPGGREFYYEIDWFNYYSSNQHLGEFYDRDGHLLFLDHRAKNGGYLSRENVSDAKQRYTRVLPNLLLADALKQKHTLQHLGDVQYGQETFTRISYTTTAGDTLELNIQQNSHLLTYARHTLDLPPLGDTEIEWKWKEFQDLGDFTMPKTLSVSLGGREMKTSRMNILQGVQEDTFMFPPDYDLAPRPEKLRPLSDHVPYGQRPADVTSPEAGIYLVKNLRPGFQMFFVEFEEFVLAVDAPSGWYEMQQIPPMNWSYGDDSNALGRKYIRAIKEAVPDKPIKYVVLTHHHNDHIGGVAPFISQGVEIVAGLQAAQLATSVPGMAPSVTLVEDALTIADDSMEVQLIELPDGNLKADGYLMVYLPQHKTLYTAAFIYPVPEAAFPPAESLELSLYFVDWLDKSRLDVETIYNVHAGGLVENWQLEHLRAIARKRAQVK